MQNPTEFLQSLLRYPEGELIPAGANLTPYYQPCGFTIYRTAYGPGSDQHWQTLISSIRTDVEDQVFSPDRVRHTDPVAQQVLSLFHLDARSDDRSLKNLDLEQLRKVFRDEVGGRPMNIDNKERWVFLLVDKEVINEQIAKSNSPAHDSWIKCVEVDHDAAEHVPRNTRASPQRYFGWMKMGVDSVPQLWSLLGNRWMCDIAPPTVDGVLREVWHDYGSW